MEMTKQEIAQSMRTFVDRRDELLHEDDAAFEVHLNRFVDFCQNDPLVQKVLAPLVASNEFDVDAWWSALTSGEERGIKDLRLPGSSDAETAARFKIIASFVSDTNNRQVWRFGFLFGKRKLDESITIFRTIMIRPFADELTHRLGDAANLATPQERALQAVPLVRIPKENEIRIFLSHKTVDKPLVYRYYHALNGLGFTPWLDETNMPAGANLERAVFKGFEESCAAVFFITDNFKDEKYLAAEVDYAVMQKRKKDNKFAIITLRYSNAAPVPDLLTPYIYKTVENDLDGFRELVRSLPIELGPVRWKAEVID